MAFLLHFTVHVFNLLPEHIFPAVFTRHQTIRDDSKPLGNTIIITSKILTQWSAFYLCCWSQICLQGLYSLFRTWRPLSIDPQFREKSRMTKRGLKKRKKHRPYLDPKRLSIVDLGRPLLYSMSFDHSVAFLRSSFCVYMTLSIHLTLQHRHKCICVSPYQMKC